jgi:hypothetical protein
MRDEDFAQNSVGVAATRTLGVQPLRWEHSRQSPGRVQSRQVKSPTTRASRARTGLVVMASEGKEQPRASKRTKVSLLQLPAAACRRSHKSLTRSPTPSRCCSG